TNPFVLPAKNGEIRGQTNLTSEYSEVPILVRVAYKTDSPNTISKVYSTDVDDDNKATLDRWFKHYDQYFKDNKNLDKLVIDLGKANKINNATIKYCVFDINEDTKIIKPNLRYVSWTEFDQLEKPQDKNGDLITAKATPIFDTFVFKENEAFFSIDSMKTYFHFEKANVAKEAMMKLDSLKIPDIIRDLSSFKYAKKETWSVNGRVFGKELQENSHFALCYSFRSYLASSRAVYITSNDFKTVQSSISDGWKILDVLH
ncbi:MAG: hypothetical protein K0R49_113, partial [Burkholderiales bacterium]|nr:hypothetical protein [Burkholderiales bacterium]